MTILTPTHTIMVLLHLISQVAVAAAEDQRLPIAIKRQPPNSNDKILADHLAFAPFLLNPPSNAAPDSRVYPAFAPHNDGRQEGILPRAAQALDLLLKRTSCPAGMNSCGDSGSPNKCCPQGTYCTSVPDTDVGHVACCPSGSICAGAVGKCPSDATSCPPALGGGCCIPGYVCQGVGCVPNAPPAVLLPTTRPGETITYTRTTVVIDVTHTAASEARTQTNTQVIVPTTTGTAPGAGNPPWRPIGSPEPTTPAAPALTQTGCPTGFYGCLAIHGGGCCRTDRDCHTYSCPPPPFTTLVNNGVTIVVPVANRPTTPTTGSATCASGWFLCGKNDGAAAGCCPSGYECGSASCFSAGATATSTIQKEAPDQSFATRSARFSSLAWCLAALAFLL
ncbi:hypothetical protein E4U42_004897 [Claviceps africana]|uniref:GPI anchored protein n=1 Tax=Claviceps africana TaxID=83212 RepID=A0A8K0NGP8_9HYPO|nr:hypothetical protein E4U42_004897 [Claviceps africana]